MAAGGSTGIQGEKGAESCPEYSQARDQEIGGQLLRRSPFLLAELVFYCYKSYCALNIFNKFTILLVIRLLVHE